MDTPIISRRGPLGGLATGGALVATGGLTLPALAKPAVGSTAALPARADVMVVGGGISGLVAAREVAHGGRSVVLVEARDRVGGRVLNHTLRGGAVIEPGGAFVGPTQDHLLALAAELGVPTFKEYVAGDNIFSNRDNTLRYTGTVPLLFFLWYFAAAGNEANPGSSERSSGTADGGQDSRLVGGSTWRQYAGMPLKQRRTAMLQGFAKIVGPEALNAIEYVEHDWTQERWAMGSPVASAGPSTLTSFGSQIREPFGRVRRARRCAPVRERCRQDNPFHAQARSASGRLGDGAVHPGHEVA